MTIDPSQFEPGTTAWMEAVLAADPPPDPRDAELVRLQAELEATRELVEEAASLLPSYASGDIRSRLYGMQRSAD